MSETSVMKSQAEFDVIITTTEMHTGGEPVRIIESGYPVPQGTTIQDKIEYLRKNHDTFRKMTMWEPRGHFDMYGVLLVTPDHPEADIGVIFLHNEGYSQMCGHAVVSMGRYAVDRGLLKRPITSPRTRVNIQAPCGLVRADVQVDNGQGVKTGRVCFESVSSFVVTTDYVSTAEAKDKVKLSHPENPAYLYGVIVIDSREEKADGHSTNVCVFADSETDRSPCGSGTTARVTLMYHRGLLALGERHVFRSGVTGSEFVAWPEQETEVAEQKAVTIKLEGQGYYTGRSTLSLERGDILGRGFLVR
ncbi:trans-L-3-hydroxyproline dehydratase-like [Aplysia californica]|uniref:trans-L-3-hydroxyproline dehydratase n=1 Tax=Aplysia californica TaxID=6500 RepID=A0ABM1A401_APLCA|nr:trans-L-3-hydroxyproline dehydratase-like [Aplysia californica]